MGQMKTRDRILETSLLLFNEEGEHNVTTVDIANEMDISPGNLYYHFKGKESILDALFTRFDSEFGSLLRESGEARLDLKDYWFFIYVVFEEIHKYRFLFVDLGDIMLRYKDIEKRFRRLVGQIRSAITLVLENLAEQAALKLDKDQLAALGDTITMVMLYWFSHQRLSNPNLAAAQLIHSGVYRIMCLVGPYVSEGQREFVEAVEALYAESGALKAVMK
jgi:AcrR family transcriptional regulator